jgi:asparagine synthase (glutamine-hydrolysing)
MCGIAGFWNLDGTPAEVAILTRMLAALAHRGPDGQGEHVDGALALGHRRLAILDTTERAHQPMVAPGGAGVLTYNGEVYNHRELRRRLEQEGARFAGTGDAEVVMHALARWGPRVAVPRLDGMFAFAWWDPGERALWLARDRLGIKPLVVARRGSTFAFSSEIRGLHAHPLIPSQPDARAVSVLAFRGRLTGRWTPFQGVESVPPGTLRRVTQAGEVDETWWHALSALDTERLLSADPDPARAVSDLDAALEASVRTHLVSDAPLGAFLSGGVDSSLLVAHARRAQPRLTTWVANVGGDAGEGAQAARVARHLDVPLESVEVDRRAWARLWPHATLALEQPSYGTADSPLLAVARAARDRGRKVMLSGEGSDELFGGYPRYGSTWRLWRRRARRRLLTPWALRRHRRDQERLADAPLAWSASREDPVLRLSILGGVHGEEELLAHELHARLAGVPREADRALLAGMLSDLYDHLAVLLHRHDRLGMAASLELRVPFLAHAVVDMALHLPPRLRYARGQGKWIVKRAAERHLPSDVVWAEKRGFSVPEAWTSGLLGLLEGGALPDLLRWGARQRAQLPAQLERHAVLRARFTALEIWARLYARGEDPDVLADRLEGLARSTTAPG